MSFAQTVRRLRKEKKLTQKQVAQKMGLTAPAVTQWEAGGGIDMPNLRNLAKVLGCPTKVLVEAYEADSTVPILANVNGQNSIVSPVQEVKTMADDGLGNTLLRDLIGRIERLERKVLDKEEVFPENPPHRRKG